MQDSVYLAFLSSGKQTFAELSRRPKSSNKTTDVLKNDGYQLSGEAVFERYKLEPNRFVQTTGLTVTVQAPEQIRPISAEDHTPTKPAPELTEDLLDSLIKMPIDQSTAPKSFAAEQLVYGFEEASPNDAFSQTLGIHQSNGRSHDQDSPDKTRNGQLSRTEERTVNSDIASPRESDSVSAVRSSDRIDRKSNFSVLQEHINTLTEENCDLRRALELQQRLTSNLTQENQTLGDEYNIQAHKLEESDKKLLTTERLFHEQQEALLSLKRENELAHAAEQGAQDRVKSLVQENVSLEDRLRDLRVSEIRMSKVVEELKEEVEGTKKRERQLENENRNLTDILNNIREENNLLRAQMHNPDVVATPSQLSISTAVQEQSNVITNKMIDVGIQLDPHTPPPSPRKSSTDSAILLRSGSMNCGTLYALDLSSDTQIFDAQILQTFSMEDENLSLTREEQQVLSSVHELVNALDDQRKAMISRLRAANFEIQRLRADNSALTLKVAVQTQMRETEVQRDFYQRKEGKEVERTMPSVALLNGQRDQRQGTFFGGWFGRQSKATKSVSDYIH